MQGEPRDVRQADGRVKARRPVGREARQTEHSARVLQQAKSGIGMIGGAPARLGAKETGHNLVRERPKCGNNLVRKRQNIGHSLERERPSRGAHFNVRTPKIQAQSSMRTERDLGTILWAIDEDMGTNLQALYSSSAV